MAASSCLPGALYVFDVGKEERVGARLVSQCLTLCVRARHNGETWADYDLLPLTRIL